MLELGPLHGDVGGLGPRGVELRLGLGDVGPRRRPALEARRGELQRRLERGHRLVQELLLRVHGAELEVVDRQLGVEAEASGLEIGRGGGGLVPGRRHRPADPAPEVDLVREVDGGEQIATAAQIRARAL